MIYWIGYFLCSICSALFFPLRVTGRENLPKGSCLLASNHISNLDPIIVGLVTGRRTSYLAKDSLFKKGVAWIMYGVGAFPVKRGSADIGSIREALRRLGRGEPLVVFPEGTRKKQNGGTLTPHPGIALIAVKSGCPVVPIYVKGAEKVLPPGSRFLHRHDVEVIIGRGKVYQRSQPMEDIARQIVEDIYSLA